MKKYAFTLAEILITMVILGFVAALSIPMLGMQKMKKPNTSAIAHGIFECYYGEDGNLHQYYSDEKTTRDEIINGTSCSFTAPPANYYAITTIGAGGIGGYSESIPSYALSVESSQYSVPTNDNFYSTLHNMPSEFHWVFNKTSGGKSYWDTAAPFNNVNYTIYAGVGKGGASNRAISIYPIYKEGYNYCANCLTIGPSNCPEDCFVVQTCGGGNSGMAFALTLKNITLNSEDKVSFSKKERNSVGEYASLKIGDKSIYLNNAPAGSNATVSNDGKTCLNGIDATTPAPVYSNNGFDVANIIYTPYQQNYGSWEVTDYPNYNTTEGDAAVEASLQPSPSHIDIVTEYFFVKPHYGTSGMPGNVVMRVYEKLPHGELTVTPAQNSNETSVVYIQNAENQKSFLSIASAGNKGKEIDSTPNSYTIKSVSDLPFPSELMNDVIPKSPDIYSAIGSKLKSKIDELSVPPGTSGYGGYPFLRSVSENLIQRIGNKHFESGDTSIEIGNISCLSGQLPLQSANGWYCAATEGTKGAVKIEW